ncbi:hypothetical protein K469DRAFT_611159, partial [Zopfia rhizophila CBS 207.26]
QSRVIKGKIVRPFQPITIAPVMVVRIHEPALLFKGDFILRVYGRDVMVGTRRYNRTKLWALRLDIKYRQLLLSGADLDLPKELDTTNEYGFCYEDNEDYVDPEDMGDSRSWNEARREGFVHAFCRKRYRSEAEAYRPTEDIGGKDVPRLIAYCDIPDYHISTHTDANLQYEFAETSGSLVQYVHGFSTDRTLRSAEEEAKALRETG